MASKSKTGFNPSNLSAICSKSTPNSFSEPQFSPDITSVSVSYGFPDTESSKSPGRSTPNSISASACVPAVIDGETTALSAPRASANTAHSVSRPASS